MSWISGPMTWPSRDYTELECPSDGEETTEPDEAER
jgi:hypothetical protein